MLQHLIRPSLFLDRDGVINTRIPGAYIDRIEDWQAAVGLGEAMRILARHFHRIVVVTNQAGIGKGLVALSDVEQVNEHMLSFVATEGGRIDKVYLCPHHKNEGCDCRKPSTGMALQAKADFPDIDFRQSIMVGDSLSDMQFGQALGMHTVLIEGKKEEAEVLKQAHVDYRFHSLLEFARFCTKAG